MIKRFCLVLFLYCHLVFADCLLYESREYAIEGAEAYRESCESYGGGGGKFSYSVSESSSNNTCGGRFVENAFVLRVSCNTCSSLEMLEELEENKKYCNENCKTPMMYCMTDLNAWGSTLNGSRESCGLDDHSLPGCEESSSSETEQSSSSENQSSSFTELSSSIAVSSDGNSVSSSSKIDEHSSSSEMNGFSSSEKNCGEEGGHCEGNENVSSIFPCYKRQSNGSCAVVTYVSFEPLPMADDPEFIMGNYGYFLGFYIDGKKYLYFNSNVPLQDRSNTIVNSQYLGNCYYDENNCGGQETPPPVITEEVYYCRAIGTSSGCKISSNVTTLAISEDLKLKRADTNIQNYPSNFTDNQALDIANVAAKNYTEVQVWCAEKETNIYAGHRMFASGDTTRTIKDIFDASEFLFDICKEYSSSSSNNLTIESSSSNFVQSSSSLEESSSSGESSSSEEISSSSEYVLCQTLSSADRSNASKNSCFESSGKCYRCNAARTTSECSSAWSWVSPSHIDNYFFTEIDCESGERKDDNRIGQCPGFAFESVPDYPTTQCFAYNGSCYKCNSSNSFVDCSADWLWIYSFDAGLISRGFYEQVDCYDPLGEDDFDGQCPDRFYLEKSIANDQDYSEITNYTIDYSASQKNYDALGRFLNGKHSSFLKTFTKQKNKIVSMSDNTFDVGNIIYIPVEKIGLSQNFLAKEGEECPDYPCGDIGKDYGVGNDVGVYCGHPCTKPIMENGFLRIEVTNKRQTGSCGKNNPKYTITFKLPATATIKRKNEYHVAPIGYRMGNRTVTIDEYEAAERHEIGHKESFSCLEDKNMFKSYYEFVLENVCEKNIVCDENDVLRDMMSTIKNKMNTKSKTGIDELVRYNDELWLKMCGWYHKTFSHEDGPGGPNNPATLTCPTTNTLLNNNYDLTGCEIIK